MRQIKEQRPECFKDKADLKNVEITIDILCRKERFSNAFYADFFFLLELHALKNFVTFKGNFLGKRLLFVSSQFVMNEHKN